MGIRRLAGREEAIGHGLRLVGDGPATGEVQLLMPWAAGSPGRVAPATVPMQPEPLLTRATTLEYGGVAMTAILREWAPGDPERCRLCTRCRAYGGRCLVLVAGRIPRSAAPLLSTVGLDDRTGVVGGEGPRDGVGRGQVAEPS